MSFDAEIEQVDAATVVVKLTGRMTLGTPLREVEGKLNQAIESGAHRLIFEAGGIDFADSAGLGLLMLFYGRMKKVGGSVRIVAPSPTLQQLLELTNTDKILPLYPDRAAALTDEPMGERG